MKAGLRREVTGDNDRSPDPRQRVSTITNGYLPTGSNANFWPPPAASAMAPFLGRTMIATPSLYLDALAALIDEIDHHIEQMDQRIMSETVQRITGAGMAELVIKSESLSRTLKRFAAAVPPQNPVDRTTVGISALGVKLAYSDGRWPAPSLHTTRSLSQSLGPIRRRA
jgi:hypothetical protein